VVVSSGGYPGRYETGKIISGLDEAKKEQGVVIFHAGTKSQSENGKTEIVTSGGRVLNVVGVSETIKSAIEKTYRAVEKVDFEGKHFRRDIGLRAIKRSNEATTYGTK
jgi:phosphoribosylamine--glycine ligase